MKGGCGKLSRIVNASQLRTAVVTVGWYMYRSSSSTAAAVEIIDAGVLVHSILVLWGGIFRLPTPPVPLGFSFSFSLCFHVLAFFPRRRRLVG